MANFEGLCSRPGDQQLGCYIKRSSYRCVENCAGNQLMAGILPETL